MPLISSDQLLHLPVVTESGTAIGHVRRWDMDIESYIVLRYYVQPAGLVQRISRGELCIVASLVVSISKKRMVVRDGAEKLEENATRMNPLQKESAMPAMTRGE